LAIAKAIVGTFLLRIVGMFATLLCSVLLARLLGVAEFGAYSFTIALVTILALPAQAGIPTLLLRETAKAKAIKDWAAMKGIWLWTGCTVAFLGLVIIICSFLIRSAYTFEYAKLNESIIIPLGVVMSLLVALGNVRGAALRGLGFVIKGQLPEEIIKPVSFLFLLSLVYMVGQDITSVVAMGLHLVAAVFAFFYGAWLLLNAKPRQINNEKPKILWSKWAFTAMPLALMAGIQTFNSHIDILMLGALGTVAQVGVYKVVVSGAALTVFGLQVSNVVIAPRLASSFATNNVSDAQKIASYGSLISFVFTLPILLVFLFYGEWLLGFVFGEEYRHGHTALLIITVSQVVSAFFGSSISLMTMSSNERHVLTAMTTALLVNLILNTMLIPTFGIEGAAYSTAASIVIWNGYLWLVAKVKMNVDSTFVWLLLNKFKRRG